MRKWFNIATAGALSLFLAEGLRFFVSGGDVVLALTGLELAGLLSGLFGGLGGLLGGGNQLQERQGFTGDLHPEKFLANAASQTASGGEVIKELNRRPTQLRSAFAQQPPTITNANRSPVNIPGFSGHGGGGFFNNFSGAFGGLPISQVGVTGRDPALDNPGLLSLPGLLGAGQEASNFDFSGEGGRIPRPLDVFGGARFAPEPDPRNPGNPDLGVAAEPDNPGATGDRSPGQPNDVNLPPGAGPSTTGGTVPPSEDEEFHPGTEPDNLGSSSLRSASGVDESTLAAFELIAPGSTRSGERRSR